MDSLSLLRLLEGVSLLEKSGGGETNEAYNVRAHLEV